MTRRRRSNKDALLDGLIGAGIGAMNFKLSENARRQAEDAELRKEQRLAAIRAGETEAAQQFTLQRDQSLAEAQAARDTARSEAEIALADKNIAAALEREKVQTEGQLRVVGAQGANQLRIAQVQGGNQIAAAREGRSNADVQTYQDANGQYHQITLDAAGQQRLGEMQKQGAKLQLVEGSRGGRYTGLPDDGGGEGPLMRGGVPSRNGAASPTAAPAALIWNPETQRLEPAAR